MEKIADSSEKLKQIAILLHKCLECPVCVDTLQVPFMLCARGHGICNSCSQNLTDCSTCHGAFTIENPICVKNILEEMPRLCCNADYGCAEIFDPGNVAGMLEKH
uniref:E3 ubiquitin-protein ligase Sina-like RING finger domain-containing protein n=1 Tax=Graphocephala atropunctata TaxID=36148 RepID=A0A1B6LRQ5_9HEMI